MRQSPLRRVLLSTAATVLGIVLLLSLKPDTYPGLAEVTVAAQAPATASSEPSLGSPAASPSQQPTAAPSSPSPSATRSKAASPKPSATPSRTSTSAPAPRTTQPPADQGYSGTVTGKTIDTKYGPVQVQIKLSDGKITAAAAVQVPDETARSQQISAEAVPQLNQETLAAQSADIDAVSGATYTSAGYIKSLQSALDKAGV